MRVNFPFKRNPETSMVSNFTSNDGICIRITQGRPDDGVVSPILRPNAGDVFKLLDNLSVASEGPPLDVKLF